jgi:RNA polymerase sigma factor (sigma-70 family)
VGDVALERQLEVLHPASFSWALSCCRYQASEARDVLQESYLKVLDGRARFGGRAQFKTWLFSVIRRTAADRRRRAWIDPTRWFEPRDPPTPDADAERAQRRERVRQALTRLATRQREVLELVFYQDLTVEEAASAMGVTVGTARVHYDRAKKRVLQELAGNE